ncbi:hypothetical protein ACRAWD_26530 [Caulobacter segnis]
MRVLTFLHSFEPGGVERIALRLVRRWRALNVDAPLFLGRTDGDMRDDVGAGLDFILAAPGRHTHGQDGNTLDDLDASQVVSRRRPPTSCSARATPTPSWRWR